MMGSFFVDVYFTLDGVFIILYGKKKKNLGAIYSQTAPVILKFWVDYICLHILIEIYLTFNIMLVSGVQHNDSKFAYIVK